MTQARLSQLAQKYSFSLEAVDVLARALQSTGGSLAQFNHPELGGMGQWMPGMIMIGDMFNHALKARVDGLCTELVGVIGQMPPMTHSSGMPGFAAPSRWWPVDLGTPNATGGQNEMRYAYFAAKHRLIIDDGGEITLYDTTGHEISGVSQQQHNNSQHGRRVIVFTTPSGTVEIAALKVVRTPPASTPMII